MNCHFKGHQALSKESTHKDKIKLWGEGGGAGSQQKLNFFAQFIQFIQTK